MEKLSRQAITNLVTTHTKNGPCATLYIPTHRAATPPNMTEDQIRCKNLFHKAIEMLKEHPTGEPLAKLLNNTLDTLLNDASFWELQTEGLLVCAAGETIQMFHLPIDTEEYAAVDEEYHLAAAMALVAEERPFYVLALAQHDPMLYSGDMFELKPTELQLPESVETGLNLDEPNHKSEQQRSDGGANSNAGGFNGRGGARDPREENRLRFWRLIDQKVTQFVDQKLPIILAGTENDIVEFRGLSRHANVLEDYIEGNSKDTPLPVLFAESQKIIDHDITAKQHRQYLEEYQRLSGANPERVASRTTEISEAAEAGRIETLLLGIHRFTTDTVRDNMTPVPIISFPDDPKIEAAANHVAQQVFATSGQVVAIDKEAMPNHAPILARLRY